MFSSVEMCLGRTREPLKVLIIHMVWSGMGHSSPSFTHSLEKNYGNW